MLQHVLSQRLDGSDLVDFGTSGGNKLHQERLKLVFDEAEEFLFAQGQFDELHEIRQVVDV